MVEARDQIPKLSIREKSKERSYAKKYLHGNFKSGHKTPNEHYLSRAGLRGRKRWLCLALFILVYLFALAHLVLTCVILGVLRFNHGGSPHLIFQDDGSLSWPQGANLSNVLLSAPSSIHSYTDQTLTLSGQQDDQLAFQVSPGVSQLSLDHSSVSLSSESVQAYSQGDVRQLSVSESTVEMKNLLRANSLKATTLMTHTIGNVSELQTSGQLLMRGAVGVTVLASQLDIDISGNALISSQRAITVGERVALPSLPGLSPSTRYHLCSCESGRLFVVQSNSQRCAVADNSICT